MKLRYTEEFNKEEMMKYVKGELALEGKPFTEENLQKKMDDLYYEWLASKVNDVIHKDDGINETFEFLYTLREVPIKYCITIEQWMEGKPIHYKGEYFNFEEIYDNAKKNTDETGMIDSFDKLVECVICFYNYEESMKKDNLCKKKIEMYEKFLKGDMGRVFFLEE